MRPDAAAPGFHGHALSLADALSNLPSAEGARFAELFRHGSLAVEIYAPVGRDPQEPHTRDEVYVVARGSGDFVCGTTRTRFEPGHFLFVPAGVIHRFETFTPDLAVWVLFYGPQGGEAP